MEPKGDRKMKRIIAIAVILGTAALWGRSVLAQEPSPTSTSSPAPVDACRLVTNNEASAALGTGVTSVSHGSQCTYVTDGGSGRALGVAAPQGLEASEYFGLAMENAATALGAELISVSDVGDEAYALVETSMAEIMARRDNAYVVVALTLPLGSRDEQVSKLSELARTALGRL